MKTADRLTEFVNSARAVTKAHGVSWWRQVAEIRRLGRGPGRIGPGDYYAYGLFDPGLDGAAKSSFIGWRAESELDALNDRRWQAMGLDKIVMYTMLVANGTPVPQTRAVYLPGRRRALAGAESLTSLDELIGWLRNPSHYPLFAKPSAGGFGRGSFLATRVDEASGVVELADGTVEQIDRLIARFDDRERLGYLLQQPLKSDPRLTRDLGAIVSSLRIMVLYDDVEGPVIHRAFWKLPTGRNMHDNYGGGVSGNLAAAVDMKSGCIMRVITGVGLGIVDVERHPDTGRPLDGVAVPDWPDVIACALDAATVFPKLGFQQWDIALTDQGPVALEVNLFGTGGSELSQMLYRRGLRDERMNRFLGRIR